MSCGFVRFFQKASELARREGLPRVYVSCNSGARVGLVEELKPLYKALYVNMMYIYIFKYKIYDISISRCKYIRYVYIYILYM